MICNPQNEEIPEDIEQEIKPGKKIFIWNTGKDEYWLQDIIDAIPEKSGLDNGRIIRLKRYKVS